MEVSSPLAAMRPPPMSHQLGALRPGGGGPFASGTAMSLRDRLDRTTKTNYFGISMAGASPTASLAADLSQNFRIDSDVSPHCPTPRRALFTSAVVEAIAVSTPGVPGSSPPVHDMMDISPFPYKAPVVSEVEMTSPTPIQTPSDEDDTMQDSPLPRKVSSESLKLIDRRKSGIRRPSLTRAKGYSVSGVGFRSHVETLSAFRFGGDSKGSPSLDECFDGSPLGDRRPQTANSPTAAVAAAAAAFRPRNPFAAARPAASAAYHLRRPSNPPVSRPRKQYRRSVSMFESPNDVVKPKPASHADSLLAASSTLQSVMDVDEDAYAPRLPHFLPEDPNDAMPRITHATMLDVLDGKHGAGFDQKLVIDCRFEYEYDGGHIDGAINYNDKELLATHLFDNPLPGRTLVILHCEYSAHRAPIMARHVRAADRAANADLYPRLTYPDVYVLDGGYSAFFADHPSRCYPQAYVEMHNPDHVNTCEREIGRLRNARKGLFGF